MITEEQLEQNAWMLVAPAVKRMNPQDSDGYDEVDIYNAAKNGLSIGYSTAEKEYKEKADKWDALGNKIHQAWDKKNENTKPHTIIEQEEKK